MSPPIFAPWQVLVGLLTLVAILGTAVLLARIHPVAVAGLVPVLVSTGHLVQRLLVRIPPHSEPGDERGR